jgi:hypothetical protein
MNTRFTIAPLAPPVIGTIGYVLLSLLTPSILNAQTLDYGTTRQLRTCTSRAEPRRGPITPELATKYAICGAEKEIISMFKDVSSINFVDIQNLQIAPKSRRASWNEFPSFRRIDIDKPVYDIRANVTRYTCRAIIIRSGPFPDTTSYHRPGKNCSIDRVPESNGSCYQNTFAEWHCTIGVLSKKQEKYMPPPAN